MPAEPLPEFGLYLQSRRPPPVPWEWQWLQWRDGWIPADPQAARDAFRTLWERAEDERVEVACSGGQGRTGTALVCLAILDGVAPTDAIRYVRDHYRRRAVETPWQRRFVARFAL